MMQLDKCPFAFPREIPYKRHRFRHIFQVKNLHVIFYQSSQLLHLIMLMITSFWETIHEQTVIKTVAFQQIF